MPGPTIAGTFATGAAASVGNASDVCNIHSSATQLRLTVAWARREQHRQDAEAHEPGRRVGRPDHVQRGPVRRPDRGDARR